MTLVWLRRLLAVAGATLLLLGVGTALAFRYDAAHRDEFLPGVTVGGVAAGGQSAAAIARRLDAGMPGLAATPIRVTAASEESAVTLGQMGLGSDARAALARARADAAEMGIVGRTWHRVLDKPLGRDYPVRLHVDPDAVRRSLQDLADRVEMAPVNAKVDASSGFVTVLPASEGRSLDLATTADRVYDLALRRANGETATSAVVDAPVVVSKPEVTGFSDVILVRTGENRLYHYENGEVRKTYVVSTGTSRYPTPKGHFSIVEKRRNPTWVNPDPKGWGSKLPARIGPGPSNPLGTRALNVSSPGIRIHGTRNVASLGTAASHGCIRMSIADSEELFELVESGTPVVIIQGPPPPPQQPDTPVTSLGDPNSPVDLEAG